MSEEGSITRTVEILVASGASPETILNVVRELEKQKDDAARSSREKARARVQKWRDRKAETERNVTERSVAATKRLTRVEDISSNKHISGEDKKDITAPKARESDLSAFKAELSDIDPERVEAIVKHRRSKRGQLTGHAARLFKNDASACGMSVSQAIDTCISRNWITVKPEYFRDRQRTATSPPSGQKTFNDVLNEYQGIAPNAPHAGPTIDASHDRTDSSRAANLVQLHAFSARR